MRQALVLHASRHGSTAQVADHIATRLERHGYHLQVRPVRYQRGQVGPEQLVVLGIAVHRGRCHPEARRFLHRHRQELTRLPLAVFSLAAGTDAPATKETMLSQVERAQKGLARGAPLTATVFCLPDVEGMMDLEILDRSSIERWADALVGDV